MERLVVEVLPQKTEPRHVDDLPDHGLAIERACHSLNISCDVASDTIVARELQPGGDSASETGPRHVQSKVRNRSVR